MMMNLDFDKEKNNTSTEGSGDKGEKFRLEFILHCAVSYQLLTFLEHLLPCHRAAIDERGR